ncbi:unnamed protein product [Dibothriocephalus latus]|uniref:RIIa domain-containing protein n=1 Tax=Dibothriocephalus latus TaxID=60516 RepID=A0A3P6PV71_DIBLA|nr:unnamed protein product [Dibothriocephalus latus]
MFANKRTENGSTNLTDDTAYLIKELGQPLREALIEVAIKKPRDPIEFIARFLQHGVETREYERQAEEDFRLEQEFERELAEKRANALRLNNERKTIEAEKMAKVPLFLKAQNVCQIKSNVLHRSIFSVIRS